MAYEPVTFPRRWLPADWKLTGWEALAPWFSSLETWPLTSREDLEAWLDACWELLSALGEERASRYVAMTCQTDDPLREAAYLEFVRDIEPKVKAAQEVMRNRYLDCPARSELSGERYELLNRSWENRRALFRAANIPRETEIDELGQAYQKRIGALTVTFQGEERTLVQMSKFLQEPDRDLRLAAFTQVAERRYAEKDALDDIFDRMIAVRQEIALEAGFANYVDYAYRDMERFDYGPLQAKAFRDAVETAVVPLRCRLHEQRRTQLGVETLRPWDLDVDPLGRPPLRPFTDAGVLADGVEQVIAGIDPELGEQFRYLKEHRLIDLANRKGKAPGGYQTNLDEQRLPFIFMNAVGVDDDLRTLLHEAGHAFHTLAARHERIFSQRSAPIEFCEVASMTMELFGSRNLSMFYNETDTQRSYRQLLEGIVHVLPWIATVDAFQHWIYANPGHNRTERSAAWSEIFLKYRGLTDWSGLEQFRDHLWHRQLHIFLYPFYYIEYGIAQLGALQIWHRSLTDKAGAIRGYRSALALGGTRPLPELFGASGAAFDFSSAAVTPLMETLRTVMDGIPQ